MDALLIGEIGHIAWAYDGELLSLAHRDRPMTGNSEDVMPPDQTLTARELEILALLALTNKDISARLGLSEHTVKFHVMNVTAKLAVESRAAAVVVAIQRGIVPAGAFAVRVG